MREWQQKRFKSICMPDAVFYQSIWAVRDLYRMEERVKEIDEDIRTGSIGSASLVGGGSRDYGRMKPTENKVMEKMRLESRIDAIRTALDGVPAQYQTHILDNVIYQSKITSIPSHIWRVWKQKFLFSVAQNLALM